VVGVAKEMEPTVSTIVTHTILSLFDVKGWHKSQEDQILDFSPNFPIAANYGQQVVE